MGKRKSSGNPLTRGVGKILRKATGEAGDHALDGMTDLTLGSDKTKKNSGSSSRNATDWATRTPSAAPRKRRSR